jgi:hypothetical protein
MNHAHPRCRTNRAERRSSPRRYNMPSLPNWPTPVERPHVTYRFHAPPGWPEPEVDGWLPPPGWRADPAWPPIPDGWRFWSATPTTSVAPPERWHGYLAAGSFVTALGCIPLFGGDASSIVLGLILLAAAVTAGAVSSFWTRLGSLSPPRKALVYAVGGLGIAVGICAFAAVYLPLKAYEWNRRTFG